MGPVYIEVKYNSLIIFCINHHEVIHFYPPYMRNVEPVTDFLRLFFMTSSSRIVYFKGTPHIESILKVCSAWTLP